MSDVAARVWRMLLDPCFETSTVSVRSDLSGRLFPCARTCKTTIVSVRTGYCQRRLCGDPDCRNSSTSSKADARSATRLTRVSPSSRPRSSSKRNYVDQPVYRVSQPRRPAGLFLSDAEDVKAPCRRRGFPATTRRCRPVRRTADPRRGQAPHRVSPSPGHR
jgi:hypothetical protein